MLSKEVRINRYGGHTWRIELGGHYRLALHEHGEGGFTVELLEWKWVNHATRFRYDHNADLTSVVRKAFARAAEYLGSGGYIAFDIQSHEERMRIVLEHLNK